MVLIAASVFTKGGKALVTRQYVADMTRARLEGLLDAFPKLVGSEKTQRQHTFVETDSVRYVYQPLENLYVVLVTTKASNILEDLETLRLFSRVVPEYCRSNEESEILDKSFDLIFAFDEIVVLGYRESVNLAQIRTFTDMDSHEERVFNQIQIAQQRAATSVMNEKVKEMKRAEKQKKNLLRQGGAAAAAGLASIGISSSSGQSFASSTTGMAKDYTSAVSAFSSEFSSSAKAKGGGSGKALKLGSKTTADENSFLAQLRQEGQDVASDLKSKLSIVDSGGADASAALESVNKNPIHIKCIEKISAVASRNGALESSEILGSVSLHITDPKYQTLAIKVKKGSNADQAQLQVHPNLDKKTWQTSSLLRLKSETKPFPVNVDIGVLKWRLQLPNEDALPLALNCWPNEAPDGCVVNIEYTLQKENFQLNNVTIAIPLPPSTVPVVSECEGSYEYVKSKALLLWNLMVIDDSNKTGTLEFSTPNGKADHFFPVTVRFYSDQLFCDIQLEGLQDMNGENEIEDFSTETRLLTEKYEVV